MRSRRSLSAGRARCDLPPGVKPEMKGKRKKNEFLRSDILKAAAQEHKSQQCKQRSGGTAKSIYEQTCKFCHLEAANYTHVSLWVFFSFFL